MRRSARSQGARERRLNPQRERSVGQVSYHTSVLRRYPLRCSTNLLTGGTFLVELCISGCPRSANGGTRTRIRLFDLKPETHPPITRTEPNHASPPRSQRRQGGHRDIDSEYASLLRDITHGKFPTIRFDSPTADRQPKPEASPLSVQSLKRPK
jgi:hypothetical protein